MKLDLRMIVAVAFHILGNATGAELVSAGESNDTPISNPISHAYGAGFLFIRCESLAEALRTGQ